ncbi:hypothetical protein ABS642_20545 [Microbacterium sp. A8/3-1]|uniref:Uncharacterized protein n=1 Tax=Microbacterium sp. A8/3-1 TaxID=3160749 RepID=A0AAU7VW08_9MICO
MSRTRSRSDSIREDEELRLPRAPGLLRRFWARHPVFADVLIMLICLVLTLGGAVSIGSTSYPRSRWWPPSPNRSRSCSR